MATKPNPDKYRELVAKGKGLWMFNPDTGEPIYISPTALKRAEAKARKNERRVSERERAMFGPLPLPEPIIDGLPERTEMVMVRDDRDASKKKAVRQQMPRVAGVWEIMATTLDSDFWDRLETRAPRVCGNLLLSLWMPKDVRDAILESITFVSQMLEPYGVGWEDLDVVRRFEFGKYPSNSERGRIESYRRHMDDADKRIEHLTTARDSLGHGREPIQQQITDWQLYRDHVSRERDKLMRFALDGHEDSAQMKLPKPRTYDRKNRAAAVLTGLWAALDHQLRDARVNKAKVRHDVIDRVTFVLLPLEYVERYVSPPHSRSSDRVREALKRLRTSG